MNFQARVERHVSGRSRTYHVAFALALIVAGFVSQTAEKGEGRWWVGLAVGAFAGIAQVGVGWFKSRATETAETEVIQALQHQLGPVAKRLSDLAALSTPAKKRQPYSALCMQAVSTAAALPKKKGVRASIFKVGEVDGMPAFVPHPMFVHGRDDLPRSAFVKGRDAEGNEVWAKAEAGEIMTCRDLDAEPPVGYDPTVARAYKTFITAPIVVDQKPVGLLTSNAPRAGDLTETDERTMSVLAHLLATAYAVSGHAWPSDGAP